MDIYYRPKYIKAYELVDQATYKKYGDFSLTFFDNRLLMLADKIRESFGVPITINTWYYGGDLDSRGLRQSGNDDHKPYSPHARGMALDFNLDGVSVQDVHDWISRNHEYITKTLHIPSLSVEKHKGGKLISWVHMHVSNGKAGIRFFDV